MEPLKIILADDDADDRFLFKEVLNRIDVPCKLTTVDNGIALLELINDFSQPIPDLIFTDINMPGKNGFDCLTAMKSYAHLKSTWLNIYSTSDAEEDIDKSFALGARLYIIKPLIFSYGLTLIKEVLESYHKDSEANFIRDEFVRKAPRRSFY